MIDQTKTLIVRLLQSVKMFDGFSQQQARSLLARAVRVDVYSGQYILREGETGREFYVVVSGLFDVSKMLANGEDVVIATLQPGDTFGEMSFLDGRSRAASVVAREAGLLLKFERQPLLKIPDITLLIYENLSKLMAARIRDTNHLVSLVLENRYTSSQSSSENSNAVSPKSVTRIG